MGISGLHKALEFCTQKRTLADFQGKTLAIDTSSWLHKSVYSVAQSYVESCEGPRPRIDDQCVQASVRYIVRRCEELLNAFGIGNIFLVMDGKRCPLKTITNQDRERKREENLAQARAFLKAKASKKAEDKFKMCIKIRDDFTKVVIAKVRKHFSTEKRVQFVWSPYEADAQLARLCMDNVAHAVVTEDSDVLVYSASTHTAFPVIFKLDRSTGACDVISMDWLLHPSADDEAAVGKRKMSAVESLLRNFASRQSRRPGVGVRLFVQACVLAGCDYAPNVLQGVGLVNAFKAVRDNASRLDEIRFEKIMASLPRKSKKGIDVKEHTRILEKSEAVFFYHVVLHTNGRRDTLLPCRYSEEDDSNNRPAHTDHFPFLSKFEGDLSFLGSTPPGSTESLSDKIPNNRKKPALKRASPNKYFNPKKYIFSNPYKSQPQKRRDHKIVSSGTSNSCFALQRVAKEELMSDARKHDKDQERSPESTQEETSERPISPTTTDEEVENERVPSTSVMVKPNPPVYCAFDYADPEESQEVVDSPAAWMHKVSAPTSSFVKENSSMTGFHGRGGKENNLQEDEEHAATVKVSHSVDMDTKMSASIQSSVSGVSGARGFGLVPLATKASHPQEKNGIVSLNATTRHPSISGNISFESVGTPSPRPVDASSTTKKKKEADIKTKPRTVEPEPVTSRYFSKSAGGPRRVTMDSKDIPGSRISQTKLMLSPMPSTRDDEIVESPWEPRRPKRHALPVTSNRQKQRKRTSVPPILAGFEKQKQLAKASGISAGSRKSAVSKKKAQYAKDIAEHFRELTYAQSRGKLPVDAHITHEDDNF